MSYYVEIILKDGTTLTTKKAKDFRSIDSFVTITQANGDMVLVNQDEVKIAKVSKEDRENKVN